MMRLSRYLARAGIDSRRHCEQLILDGRVAVNGQIVNELGSKVDESRDAVTLDGEAVSLPIEHITIMLNKPEGVVTTMNDPQGRKTVAEYVPLKDYPSLFPLGRLDADTTGLLLFTTDGNLGEALMHPSNHVDKRYIAHVKGSLDARKLKRLSEGVMLDGRMTAPAKVEILQKGNPSIVSVVIHEGRNRQVRRMFKEVGCNVVKLARESIGDVHLGDLPRGQWRELTEEELKSLR